MRFALPVALALALLSPAAADPGEYTGKYAGTGEWREVAKRLPSMREDAARAVCAKLGIEFRDASNIEIRFEDMPAGSRRLVNTAGTRTEKAGNGVRQVITLSLEVHFSGQDTIERELLHEMTHAILRNLLGEERHKTLPKWAREGLAVWVAGQGLDRSTQWIATEADKDDPVGRLVDGLENENHSLKDYPEDYFAIVALEALGGEGSIPEFVKFLSEGAECRLAAAAASGHSWLDFEAEARETATRELKNILGEKRQADYRAAIALFRAKDYGKAGQEFRNIAARHEGTWAGAQAAYYGARCLQESGKPADASGAFHDFLEGPGRLTGLMDDATWNDALCLERLERWADALAACDRLVRDFPFNSAVPQAMLRAGVLCEERLGRRDEALERYDRLAQALPKSPQAAEALRRAESLRATR